jgi:aconitate hydratase
MPLSVAHKLISSHLVEGRLIPGEPAALRIDQTLTQDATGTLVMLELEAMGLDRVRTELSVQYVDHNLIQEDNKNPDDHLFLESACRRYGIWFSRPGNGVSHPLHQERFGIPGRTLLGSDSHTPAAGAIGMLAIGAGGIDVAMAMAGEPFHTRIPEIWGVRLTGQLPEWVSAKDVILEMLRRHGVDGGVGRIIEYYGPGLDSLTAMDRHVIANMGAELGATTTVFPSDREVQRYMASHGRTGWTELLADPGAQYDISEEIDLGSLEPLLALPSSPGNVKTVREVAGLEIYQAYIGSSANPGYRDFAIAAEIVKNQTVHSGVSFDINPTSRSLLENLSRDGHLVQLIRAGARLHQAGCNGCIGMGQAPATGKLSLRTVPRNFPGRSGTRDDQVCLVSPETAAASALSGKITDPRTLGMPYPSIEVTRDPGGSSADQNLMLTPLSAEESQHVKLVKGPNIVSLPRFDALSGILELPVLLKAGNNISTDEILPAGAKVLPYRSNIPKISEFAFDMIDPEYARRTADSRSTGGHCVIGGTNYGQGSSREHAALAPRYLGLRVVIARSFARIHRQNLINFGIVPLIFDNAADYDQIQMRDILKFQDFRNTLQSGERIRVTNVQRGTSFDCRHGLSEREQKVLFAGGLINTVHTERRN